MDHDAGQILALMQRIDEGYADGAGDAVLDLEAELERRLWSLEHYLEALDEDEELQVDDGDPDGEVGVEEQFVALWHQFTSDRGSFAGLAEASEEHLRDVLECACMSGMAASSPPRAGAGRGPAGADCALPDSCPEVGPGAAAVADRLRGEKTLL